MSAFLEKAIVANRVVMFSWLRCPYCVRAKSILEPMSPDMKVYYIDSMREGDAISNAIAQKYHHDTVPAIFISGKFIGGCSDIEVLQKTGALAPMLSA